jgi:hypothetical protein
MDSRGFVSGQPGHEDIGSRLRSAQNVSVPDLGNNEWRPATCDTWRMTTSFYVRRVKRACLCDNRSVHAANDFELLRRSQGRPHDNAVNAVDRHGDQSGNFLEYHVLNIDVGAESRLLARQHKGRADVWMPGKWHLGARRKDPHPGSMLGIGGRKYERRLGEIEFVRNGLHLQG